MRPRLMSGAAGRSMRRDFSASTITAGFVAALVGVTSGITLIFEAARSLGAGDAEIASWVAALLFGMGVLTIVPSVILRIPMMVAFSAPGAAILATLQPGDFSLSEGIGAFIVCGLAMAITGYSRLFERVMNRIPVPLVSALLGGVLGRFVIGGFADASTAPWLIVITTLSYMVIRRVAPRYAIIGVLVAGGLTAALSNSVQTEELTLSLARPVYTAPSFSAAAIVSIGVPLFIVTMAGQNLPGVAALRHANYDAPISTMIGTTGIGTMVLAPFGGYAFNLSAVAAPLCLEAPAHEDPTRRYTAAISNGGFYLLAGLFGTSITGVLNAVPIELVHIVAALALLPTIGNSLAAAVRDETHREAAMFTFVVTLSGVTVAKIGSPFWGALVGVVAMAIASTGVFERLRSSGWAPRSTHPLRAGRVSSPRRRRPR